MKAAFRLDDSTVVKLKLHGKRHVLCSDSKKKMIDRLGNDADDDGRWLLGKIFSCNRIVIAKVRGRIVGFFRHWDDQNKLIAMGTWVHRDFARRGIATKMWLFALDRMCGRAASAEVTTICDPGKLFARSMKKRFRRKGIPLEDSRL